MITSLEIAKLLSKQSRKARKNAHGFDEALLGLGVHLNLKDKKRKK